MLEQKRYNAKPGIVGAFMSILLIVSFFLPRIWTNNKTVESFNSVLIIIILCLAVHLVRITCSLFVDHVWNNIGFSVLWLLPVFNLIVTASQFIWGELELFVHPVFVSFLVLFSLPAFCCYFFNVIWFFCKRDKALMISTGILDAVGLIYILIRLADRVFLPLAVDTGKEIASFVEFMFSLSPWISLAVYVFAFISFVICARLFSSSEKTMKYEKIE